jgi:hypothetical protein
MTALGSFLPALVLLACTPDSPSPQTQLPSQAISAEESTAAMRLGVAWARYNVAQSGAQSSGAGLGGISAMALPIAKAELERNLAWLVGRGVITAQNRPGPRGDAAYQAVSREAEKGRAAMLACSGASEVGDEHRQRAKSSLAAQEPNPVGIGGPNNDPWLKRRASMAAGSTFAGLSRYATLW